MCKGKGVHNNKQNVKILFELAQISQKRENFNG